MLALGFDQGSAGDQIVGTLLGDELVFVIVAGASLLLAETGTVFVIGAFALFFAFSLFLEIGDVAAVLFSPSAAGPRPGIGLVGTGVRR